MTYIHHFRKGIIASWFFHITLIWGIAVIDRAIIKGTLQLSSHIYIGSWLACYHFRKVIKAFWFFHITVQIKLSLNHKYAMKGLYKEFALQGSFVDILSVIEVSGTCKTRILMAIKSGSYIFNLDCVKLSLGVFCILSWLTESLLHQLSRYTFIFVKNTHQKATNLALLLLLAAGMRYIESCKVYYM